NIIFIHGLGSSAERWLDIPEALSLSDIHTIALDLPGFGFSSKPKIDYTIDYFSNIIIKMLDRIGIKRCYIVGHSLGGYIAIDMAIKNKDIVNKLVLIDSSGLLKEPTPILKEYLEAARDPTKGKVRAVFEKMVADPWRIPDTLVDSFIGRIFNNKDALHAFESALNNSASIPIDVERLNVIDKPTMIIWGKHDHVIPIEHCKIFNERIKGSKSIIIDDAGHAPFAEKPVIVYEHLRRFIL
ncbi:MAG: alpha/beta hydrolase, partial [Candidatus Nitrosothermus koennekii]